MKKKLLMMALAIMISLNFATAQTVLQTASASISPSEIYTDAETEIFTVITWNDATEVISVEFDLWGFIIELVENEDYVISEIDEFTSLFEFIEEDKFKKLAGTNRFVDPWYITFSFDKGEEAVLTLYTEVEIQYGVAFCIVDNLENPIYDAVVTFDGHSFHPGDYDLGLHFPGNYEFSITKDGYETIEGEIIIKESAISEFFIMYPSIVYSTVSFHVSSEGFPVDQAEINIDGLDETLYSDNQGMTSFDLALGVYTYSVSADGYMSIQGQFDLQEDGLDISLELDVVTNISINTDFKVSAYPNPASAFINIQLMPGNTNYLEVYSSNGKLIHKEVSEQTGARLDLSKHPQGIYFIKLQSGNTMQSGKFIKL